MSNPTFFKLLLCHRLKGPDAGRPSSGPDELADCVAGLKGLMLAALLAALMSLLTVLQA